METVAVVGSGHLSRRVRALAEARGARVLHVRGEGGGALDVAPLAGEAVGAFCLVDDRDERNLEALVALAPAIGGAPVALSLFNDGIAAQLAATRPNVRALNPARVAAPAFVAALDEPLDRAVVAAPAKAPPRRRVDWLVPALVVAFGAVCAAAAAFFHFSEHLSWLDAAYFVVVTAATVGYGDINLLGASASSKVAGVALILASTVFIWLIFSLTIDRIIKLRAQRALGQRRYAYRGHVVLCGLGRLGWFVAEGLLARGERVVVVERRADYPAVERLRALGADVYVGDARHAQTLEDVGVRHARALYSLIADDYANLEIGLAARAASPGLRLVLRVYDDETARRIGEMFDIRLTFSMSAIADGPFVDAIGLGQR